jgi:hypothetical protein
MVVFGPRRLIYIKARFTFARESTGGVSYGLDYRALKVAMGYAIT